MGRGLCDMHLRRVRRAERNAKTGNPPHRRSREYDWERAQMFLEDGASYREVAYTLDIPRTTLTAHLPGYGWTLSEGGQLGWMMRKQALDLVDIKRRKD